MIEILSKPTKAKFEVLLLSQLGGWVGGEIENKANSAQLELELGLSLLKIPFIVATYLPFCLQPRAVHALRSDQFHYIVN